MPIFEYDCLACRKRFSALVGVVADATPPVCPRCGGADLKKRVSRFARVRSEDDAIDAIADAADNMDMDDPRAMRRLMKDMASEMSEDLDPDEFEQAMEEEASGSGATDNMDE